MTPRLPRQFLVVLDVHKPSDLNVIAALLPAQRVSREILNLSACGIPTIDSARPIDWSGLADATERLVKRLQAHLSDTSHPIEIYVTGYAPLPIFVLLGLALSAWTPSLFVANPRKEQSWVLAPLQLPSNLARTPFYAAHEIHGFPTTASDVEGCVAVFVSAGHPPNKEAMRSAINARGDRIGAFILFHPDQLRDIDETAVPLIAAQLAEAFPQLHGLYPHASSFAFFVAGPVQLALCVGRAINPTTFKKFWLTNLANGANELVLPFPRESQQAAPLDMSSEAKLRRRDVLAQFNTGLNALKQHLVVDDLPRAPFPLADASPEEFLTRLRAIPHCETSSGPNDSFALYTSQNQLIISENLLEAVSRLSSDKQQRLAQLFILHEVFHVDQSLHSVDYHGIGRAGFVLEEIDFWADAFSLGTLASLLIRDGGPAAQREVAKHTEELVEISLQGVISFDRMEQGDQLHRLPERRLRRYLLWCLQRVRAATLNRTEDIWRLFSERLVIELAPLQSRLDSNFDKIVTDGTGDRCELLISLRGRLIREPRTPSFDPHTLIESTRRFDLDALKNQMRYVLERHRNVLAPWRQQSARS